MTACNWKKGIIIAWNMNSLEGIQLGVDMQFLH